MAEFYFQGFTVDDVVDMKTGPTEEQCMYANVMWEGAGKLWDIDSLCLSELRLMKGEMVGVLKRSDEVPQVHAVQDGLHQSSGDAWAEVGHALGERITR